jgi:hypothetical protein
MKKAADWFELLIDNVHQSSNWSTRFLTILLVLFIGAGSLYLLLNTQG